MKKLIFLLAVINILFHTEITVFANAAADERFITYDYSSDLQEYAHMVADLNNQLAEKTIDQPFTFNVYSIRKILKNKADSYTVLCRTDDGELDICTSGLKYAVKGPNGCYTLYYSDLTSANAAIDQYINLPNMIYAELDSEVTASQADFEDETTSFHSWGAEKMHFNEYLNFAEKWGSSKNVVAVIDSGVCMHPLLEPKIEQFGYDYVDADEDPTNDLFGHGTHVAGIVVDCTNGTPVFLYPIRTLNASGKGKMSNFVNAVMEAQAKGVSVINLSVESRTLSQALDTAIIDAVNAGITVVVAAGNSACDTVNICPAHLGEKGVIVVGSAEADDSGYTRSSYSNYGERVDLYTFGSNIMSCSISGGYVSNTGTSMATPHISALSAMLRLIHPDLAPQEIENRIVSAAEVYDNLRIPDLTRMIPLTEGFSLNVVRLAVGESIQLPVSARPETSYENISYFCTDPSVIDITAGKITAIRPGTAQINVLCTGFDSHSFTVEVLDSDKVSVLNLPKSLKVLEDESFKGNAGIEYVIIQDGLEEIGNYAFQDCTELRFLRIPDSVIRIGENAFPSAIILCSENAYAYHYATVNQEKYILDK